MNATAPGSGDAHDPPLPGPALLPSSNVPSDVLVERHADRVRPALGPVRPRSSSPVPRRAHCLRRISSSPSIRRSRRIRPGRRSRWCRQREAFGDHPAKEGPPGGPSLVTEDPQKQRGSRRWRTARHPHTPVQVEARKRRPRRDGRSRKYARSFELGGVLAAPSSSGSHRSDRDGRQRPLHREQGAAKQEQIVGSPDMTPAGHHGRGQEGRPET